MVCALGLVFAACGGGGSGSPSQPSTAARPARGTANIITEAEINTGAYQNALEAVQNLRPAMLIPRGVGGNETGTNVASIPIVVYQDDVRLGELTNLQNIPANRIKEIRFLNARDATTRYGTGHTSGAIVVTTKR
jgi:hypothetical protein